MIKLFRFKKKQRHQLAIVIAILIMGLLFYSSSQPYQNQDVSPLLEKILFFKPFENELRTLSFEYGQSTISIFELGYFKFVEFFIRKLAHFSSFLFLAYFWIYGLSGYMKQKKMAIVVGLLIAIGYAGFDEFHQSLTPMRTPLLEDVLLDSSGSFTGAGLFLIKNLFLNKKTFSKY